MVELVYNNAKHKLTRITLFEVDYRYNLSLYRLLKEGKPKVERAFIIESQVRVIEEKLW